MRTIGQNEMSRGAGTDFSRRSWIIRTVGVLGAASSGRFRSSQALLAEDVALIVRNRRPLDLETPVQALETNRLTPNSAFFVRSHLGEPAVGLSPWKVTVEGFVDRPLSLGLEELGRLKQVSATAVLQCAGNGRAYFRPTIPGLAWDRGAFGNAEWTGVRLADVLAMAGIKSDAAHIHFRGADGPPSPKTPAFLRSLPIRKALDPSTILATTMNGEPLPLLHGGPVRLVVPGWTGNHWMKWVRAITLSTEEAPGFYQRTGYRMPKTPAPPDAVLDPATLVPVTSMNVKSLFTAPVQGGRLVGPRPELRGVAWTGEGHVTKVEVASDRDSAWRLAELLDPPREFDWRRWRIVLTDPKPGTTVFRVRATDSAGETQPEVTPWNRSGYLWNGFDHITVEVG